MKNFIRKYTNKILTIVLLLIATNLTAQLNVDYLNHIGGGLEESVFNMTATSDGNFVIVGSTASSNFDVVSIPGANNNEWLVKVDPNGNIIWETQFNIKNSWGNGVIETFDGGFLITGFRDSTYTNTPTNDLAERRNFWVMKVDANGNFEWENTLGGSRKEEVNSAVQNADSTYTLIGFSASSDHDISGAFSMDTTYQASNVWLVNIDAQGNMISEKTFGGSNTDDAEDIITLGNGHLFVGVSYSEDHDLSTFGNNNMDSWVVRLDSNQNIVWQKQFPDTIIRHIFLALETNDGNIALLGKDENSSHLAALVKIDNNGNVLWNRKMLNIQASVFGFGFAQKSNSNFVIGIEDMNSQLCYVYETDPMGNAINSASAHGFSFSKMALALDQDENILLGLNADYNTLGDTSYGGANDRDIWLYRFNNFSGTVYGNVLIDNNDNCIDDAGDAVTDNVIIVANDIVSNDFRYGLTNTLGNYEIKVDSNPQALSFIPPSPYYGFSSCSQQFQFANISSANLIDTVDMFIRPEISCPYMEVDISTPVLRRCFSEKYYVSYCNNGTVVANNAYVEVAIDSTLTIDSSSIAWTSVVGNVYTFPLGNVNALDCGTFSISFTVTCDSSTFTGQMVCADAHAYPDTNCLPCPQVCDTEVKAKAVCLGSDSVEFSLKNVGSQVVTNVPIIGIEDVILILDTIRSLNVGDEVKWRFPTNGISTHRIIAQQPAGNSFKTFTTDAVTNCSNLAVPNQTFSSNAAFLAYAHDEESPFIAIDCQPIVASCDPNDKTAFPTGVGANHFITEDTDLEYKIRFQNTGTDTAFTVVIRDSISNLLDLSTFVAGASSHSYTYTLSGSGVLEFTYNNILLPDSFVDEVASRGFVQYKIKQQANNVVGDVILNNADIFFDFNEPVRTNTTFNEIGGIFLDTIIYKFPIEEPNSIHELNETEINVFPNPSKNNMYFEFEGEQKDLSIELFDLSGKMQQKSVGTNTNKLKINRGNLASGMYLFRIYSEGIEIAYGKLVFN